MGSLGTKIQMAIHHHYDNIKLILQFIIIGLIILVMVNSNIIAERQSRESRESTAEVIDRIDQETKRQSDEIQAQTKKLNQQFQALCFIMVKLAGEDALKNIDPPLEEQCRALTQELRDDAAADAQAQRQSNTAPVPQAPTTQPVTPPSNGKSGETPRQSPPSGGAPPDNADRSWLLGGVDSLLNGLGL